MKILFWRKSKAREPYNNKHPGMYKKASSTSSVSPSYSSIGPIGSVTTSRYRGRYMLINGVKHTWDAKLKAYVWKKPAQTPLTDNKKR